MKNRNPDLCISRNFSIVNYCTTVLHNFVPRVFTLPLSSLEGTLPCATENSGERHKGAYVKLVIAQFTIEFSVAQRERNGARNPKVRFRFLVGDSDFSHAPQSHDSRTNFFYYFMTDRFRSE